MFLCHCSAFLSRSLFWRRDFNLCTVQNTGVFAVIKEYNLAWNTLLMTALLFWGVCSSLSKGYLTFTACCLQSIQQDYTSLLSCLIQTFPANPEFRDLVQLVNRHDPDMDFFENMKHMQVKGNRYSLVPLSPCQSKTILLWVNLFQNINVLSLQRNWTCVIRYRKKKKKKMLGGNMWASSHERLWIKVIFLSGNFLALWFSSTVCYLFLI